MKELISAIFLMIATNAFSITISEIKSSPSYLYGDGIGANKEEADQMALKDLLSQISVQVESSIENTQIEKDFVQSEECKRVVKTYSNTKLYDAERIIDETSHKPNVYAFRYISRSRLQDIFGERTSRVITLINEAELAEENGKIGDALRNYYWAFALLPTIPDYKSMTYFFGVKGECEIYTSLQNKLKEILSIIKFTIKEKNSDPKTNFSEYLLEAAYQHKPVEGIVISYFDGYSETPGARWNNGVGKIRLSNDIARTSDEIRITIIYDYQNHAFDMDVKSALQEMSYQKIPESVHLVSLKSKVADSKKNVTITIADNAGCEAKLTESIRNAVEDLTNLIDTKNYGTARKYFTAAGYRDFNRLIDYGRAELISKNIQLYFVEIDGMQNVRSLPMQFNFRDNSESFSEKVNLIFNQQGIIEKLTFALSDRSLQNILTLSNFSEEEKKEVTHFMELYKTAYCLKDDSFVENVFTEDALIIVGNVINKDPEYSMEGILEQLGDQKVKYIRLSKDQYLTRLREQFDRKEFINLHFEDCTLKKLSNMNDKVFGIQISQYYYSDNYADQGYLFLLFNLTEPDKPRITVRSWQPEKFEDGTIVGIGDFRF